jgi:hypothetical protein
MASVSSKRGVMWQCNQCGKEDKDKVHDEETRGISLQFQANMSILPQAIQVKTKPASSYQPETQKLDVDD